MADSRQLALIHAEIDGELDAQQRAGLGRRVLADPETRELREDLRRLCAALDTFEQVEPPPQLQERIFRALPPLATTPSRARAGSPSWSSASHWRYAALLAGVLAGGALVYQVLDGPGPASTEIAGTMAARRAFVTLETVRLPNGPVTGRVSLYRDTGGLGLEFDLAADEPVDALITSSGQTLRVNGLRRPDGPEAAPTRVALPATGTDGQKVDVAFLKRGREVGRVTLKAPSER